MSRNDHTSNRRRTAAGVGVVTGAAFAAGFIGLGTAATAGAADGDGGAAAVTADQIQAVLKGDGVTNADFSGDTTLSDAAAALAGSSATDVLGDDVTKADVQTALGTNAFADSSDVTYAGIATDLNNAPEPVPAYTFPDGNPNDADTNVPVGEQPYSALFGAEGTGPDSIGGHNASLDASLSDSDAGTAASFYDDVQSFENTDDHPFADLLNLFDPNAFTTQTFGTGDEATAIDGTLDPAGYLVPTDFFGYFATGLDYALTGTGLTYLLNPAIDLIGAGLGDLGFSGF
jgi:hypothetical protein